MSTIITHKPYVPSSRTRPQPVPSASQSSSSSSSQSSSTSQTVSNIFSTALIPTIPSGDGDPAKRLEEAQKKVKDVYAQRQKDLANTEDLRRGGTSKMFIDMCLSDTDKRTKKSLDAIRNEFSDIGFEPGAETAQS